MKRLVLLSLALAVLTSCGKITSPVAPASPSNVVEPARAKDPNAATTVSAANLVVRSVRAHQAGAAPDAGWAVLSTHTMQIDLFSFDGGLAPLADVVIPAGAYDSLSLALTTGSTVVVDGVTRPLDVPGAVILDGDFDLSSSGVLALRLDADSAIHRTGSGRWKLKAVIQLLTTGVVANPGAFTDGGATGGTRGRGGNGGTLPHDLVD